MRRAAGHRGVRSKPKYLQAPTGGWNTRDNLDAMPETDAIILDNFICKGNYLEMRKGYSLAVGLSDAETLMSLELGTSSSSKFLAATTTNIYTLDLSAGTSTSIKGSLANGRWQYVQYKDKLFMVNGGDTPQVYDGSSISDTTFTGSGLTLANLIHVNLFKNRLMFVEKESMSYWFAGTAGAVGGASGLEEVDLSFVFQRGGYLNCIMTWTQDGGNGMDDLCVFLSSEGEVLVYEGSDPGDSTKWSLIGRYDIPKPIGRRCYEKIGGDLVIITKEGYFPLSRVLSADNANSVSLSTKLDPLIKTYSDYFDYFGWQIKHYSKGGYLFINVPKTTTRAEVEQHVLEMTTGGWSRFTNQNANCWETHQQTLYFASNSGIYQADDGTDDGNAYIEAYYQQAYTDMADPTVKQLHIVKPIYEAISNLDYSVYIGVDFKLGQEQLSPNNSLALNATLWDVSPWDTSPWGSEEEVSSRVQNIYSTYGVKYSIGVAIKNKTTTVKLYSTRMLYESGVNFL